jgi:hypothetical protein
VIGFDVVMPPAELVGTGPGGGRDGVGPEIKCQDSFTDITRGYLPQIALNAAPEVYRAFSGGATRALLGMRALN